MISLWQSSERNAIPTWGVHEYPDFEIIKLATTGVTEDFIVKRKSDENGVKIKLTVPSMLGRPTNRAIDAFLIALATEAEKAIKQLGGVAAIVETYVPRQQPIPEPLTVGSNPRFPRTKKE